MTGNFKKTELMADRKAGLRIATKLMAILGLSFVIYVLMAGLMTDSHKQPANIVIDIAALKPGVVGYFDSPSGRILVLKRTESMIAEMEQNQWTGDYAYEAEQNLAENMHPVFRSAEKELFVAYAIDPFFRCEVEFTGLIFKSICVDVDYNLAGRAYRGSHSQGNLIVPAYQLLSAERLKVMLD